jgi:hypothetical protein
MSLRDRFLGIRNGGDVAGEEGEEEEEEDGQTDGRDRQAGGQAGGRVRREERGGGFRGLLVAVGESECFGIN